MRHLASFPATLGYAAALAGLTPFALALLTPIVGYPTSFSLLIAAGAGGYAIGLSRRSDGSSAVQTAVCVGSLMLILGLAVLCGADLQPARVAVVAAVGLAALRSGWLLRDPRPGTHALRVLAIEAGLAGGGLAVATVLVRTPVFPEALALWGFFLLQSAFFLIGGPAAAAARSPGDVARDAFEEAKARIDQILADERGA